MAVFRDKIYVLFVEDEKRGIYEYDINTKKRKVFLYFTDYDAKKHKGDFSYHISAYKDNFYILRHKTESWEDITVYIDTYSKEMELISSTDITTAIAENMKDIHDIVNDHRQPVPHFYIKNGYVYYESRSTTRALFKLTKMELNSLS